MSISRRGFAKSVAAAAAGLPVTALTLADEPKAPTEPPKPDPLRIEMAAWLESIRVRYPDTRMTPEVLTLIAGDVLGDIMHCRRVSSFPLKNSDAPAFAMTVWRSSAK
jgi:hypothetical protein